MTAARICPIAEAADHAALNQDPGAVSVPGVRQRAGAQAPVCTTLTIPAPPSVNEIWRSIPGRKKPIRSREYNNWLKEAGWMVREQMTAEGCDPVPGRVNILVAVERISLSADIDNRLKATLDLLKDCKVIDDDRFVVGIAASWAPIGNRQRPKARVAIYPAADHDLSFHLSADGATGGWFLNAPMDDGEV